MVEQRELLEPSELSLDVAEEGAGAGVRRVLRPLGRMEMVEDSVSV